MDSIESSKSPWSKIVTGETSEIPPAVDTASFFIQEDMMNASEDWTGDSVDESSGGGGNVVKKVVWSKPVNGVVEVVSPVMGAVSWPALGESTNKAGTKSASLDSLDAVLESDGSFLPTVAVEVSGSSSPPSHPLHKPASVSPTSSPRHVIYTAQRSMKRGGGVSSAYTSSNGGVSKSESFDNTSGKSDNVAMDSVGKDHTYKEGARGGFGLQVNSGNGHHHQQSSYRRGNGGAFSRGQGRGNQEWNQYRNFNNRDANINMQPQRGGYRRGGHVPPSVHNSAPFIYPQMPLPVQHPYGNNVVYTDVPSSMIYFHAPVPPMVPDPRSFAMPDPLHVKIVKQIDYYFSNENLVKDTYLRRNMDQQGWVHVNLIAKFKKVLDLTDNAQLILDVMRQSIVVEVQGEKMRRRNDWMSWLMPAALHDSLASQLQGIGLDSRSSSGELSNQLQQGGGERATVA